MISHIHNTTIIVSDQARALEFYVGTLGWEKRIDYEMGNGTRFVTVAPVGGTTELALGTEQMMGNPAGTGLANSPGMDGASGITLAVENFDETYRALVERGVKFTREPETMPWGDKATWLVDPDGNTFFFVGR